MQVGVDFGTTRTVVAVVDRGNYPVVTFDDDNGDACDHFPSVVAELGGTLVYGFAALTAARAGAPVLRSFKRVLAGVDVNADTPVVVGSVTVPVLALLTGFLSSLRHALQTRSNAAPKKKAKKKTDSKRDDVEVAEVVEAVVAVPAHAWGAQRFLTLEAFRRAGFVVKAMVNEPSAAGFEYTHRQPKSVNRNRSRVIIYDLGGGTFDASVVQVDGIHHDVVGTAGHNHLGGDDFDTILFDLALAAAHIEAAALTAQQRDELREQCREAKERLAPQSKKIALEVSSAKGDRSVAINVDDYFAACTPLVEQSLQVMKPLLGGSGEGSGPDGDNLDDVAGIYLVGGGSGLPLVPRLLRERFGRRVHRSPHPAASTAIGLAIAADADAGFSLKDRLSRGFGVFRDRNAGSAVRFDAIFLPTTPVPARDTVIVTRRYKAAHNIGWFRYVECSAVDDDGEVRGELVPFAEVLFAFDPALRNSADLKSVVVERRSAGPNVEECYRINDHGLIEVDITDLDSGYRQTHRIGV